MFLFNLLTCLSLRDTLLSASNESSKHCQTLADKILAGIAPTNDSLAIHCEGTQSLVITLNLVGMTKTVENELVGSRSGFKRSKHIIKCFRKRSDAFFFKLHGHFFKIYP